MIWSILLIVLGTSSDLYGYLVVSSFPWPCRVLVNSQEMGTTGVNPLKLRLPPGFHVLKLIYNDDYEIYQKGYVIRAGKETVIYIRLKLSLKGKYKRGLACLRRGDLKSSEIYFKTIAKLYGKEPSVRKDTLFYYAVTLFKLRKYNSAAYWFKRFLRVVPRSDSAKFLLGECKFRLGYPQQAFEELYDIVLTDSYMERVFKGYYRVISDMRERDRIDEVRHSLTQRVIYLKGMDKTSTYLKLAVITLYLKDVNSSYLYLREALKNTIISIYEP